MQQKIGINAMSLWPCKGSEASQPYPCYQPKAKRRNVVVSVVMHGTLLNLSLRLSGLMDGYQDTVMHFRNSKLSSPTKWQALQPSHLGKDGARKFAACMPTPKVGVPACDTRFAPLPSTHML